MEYKIDIYELMEKLKNVSPQKEKICCKELDDYLNQKKDEGKIKKDVGVILFDDEEDKEYFDKISNGCSSKDIEIIKKYFVV